MAALITLEEAKLYLRIDSTIEDSLINDFIAAASSYIQDAVTNYDTYITYENFAAKIKPIELAIVTDMYANRSNSDKYSLSATISTMIRQLQYWSAPDEE